MSPYKPRAAPLLVARGRRRKVPIGSISLALAREPASAIASRDERWRCSGATSQCMIHVRPEAVSGQSGGGISRQSGFVLQVLLLDFFSKLGKPDGVVGDTLRLRALLLVEPKISERILCLLSHTSSSLPGEQSPWPLVKPWRLMPEDWGCTRSAAVSPHSAARPSTHGPRADTRRLPTSTPLGTQFQIVYSLEGSRAESSGVYSPRWRRRW
jgi:hypothetical protein